MFVTLVVLYMHCGGMTNGRLPWFVRTVVLPKRVDPTASASHVTTVLQSLGFLLQSTSTLLSAFPIEFFARYPSRCLDCFGVGWVREEALRPARDAHSSTITERFV